MSDAPSPTAAQRAQAEQIMSKWNLLIEKQVVINDIACALAAQQVIVCNPHYNSENATVAEHTGQEGRCEYCWKEYKRGFDEGYENGMADRQEADAKIAFRSLENHHSDKDGNNYWVHCEDVAAAIRSARG